MIKRHYKSNKESKREKGTAVGSSDPTPALPEREGVRFVTNGINSIPIEQSQDLANETGSLPIREGWGGVNETNSLQIQQSQDDVNKTSSLPIGEGWGGVNETNSLPIEQGQDGTNETNSLQIQQSQDDVNKTSSLPIGEGWGGANETNSLQIQQSQDDVNETSSLPFGEGWGGRGGVRKPGYITANAYTYPIIKDYRKDLKDHQTEAEYVLWEYLRNKKTGHKIRRQHIIGDFIADFVCLSKKVIIEIDGKIHNFQKEQDEQRTTRLNKLGYEVIRFTNAEVLNSPYQVAQKIKVYLKTRPDSTSPTSS